MTLRRATVVLLAAQAGLGAAALVAFLIRPSLGALFLPAAVPPELILAFAAADLAFYVAAPGLAALGLARGRPWARAALWAHVGASAYAALLGWGVVVRTGDAALGAALLTPGPVLFAGLGLRLREPVRD